MFDENEMSIVVIDNQKLPLVLRDTVIDTSDCKSIKEGVSNYDKLRQFFADRVLLPSRQNAKQILESIQNSQKLTEKDRMELSLKCRAVSMTDNFWVKEDEEDITFGEVNIRSRKLSDIVFQISMKGTPVSIEHSLLDADISTKGMFRKTWIRLEDGVYLCKSDMTSEKVNTKAEIEVSRLLDEAGYPHVVYDEYLRDGEFCCLCKCFADDKYSFVDAEYVKAYVERKGIKFLDYIHDRFLTKFADMVIIDYCFGNPDEHINNWGFMVDNNTNEVVDLGPIFDNNQAMIIFQTGKEKEFDELIYEPTGSTMLQAALKYIEYASVDLSGVSNLNVRKRYEYLQKAKKAKALMNRVLGE